MTELFSEDVSPDSLGEKSIVGIREENAKEAYLFTTCCDREYFNKVGSSEVRNFPRSEL